MARRRRAIGALPAAERHRNTGPDPNARLRPLERGLAPIVLLKEQSPVNECAPPGL